MCKCTPQIRTPFCGRPGCEWPEQQPPPGEPALVKSIVGDIAAMEYAGDVKAIAAVIIDRDGDVRTLFAYQEGAKLPLTAGVAYMQHEIIGQARTFNKKRDI